MTARWLGLLVLGASGACTYDFEAYRKAPDPAETADSDKPAASAGADPRQIPDGATLPSDDAPAGPGGARCDGPARCLSGVCCNHQCTHGWQALASQTDATLRAIIGTAPNDVMAVGDGGAALHYDGAAWRAIPPGVQTDLRAVAAVERGRYIAVGNRGAILEYGFNAGEPTWHAVDAPTRVPLNAVVADDRGNVYAAGHQGVVLQRRAGTWRKRDTSHDDVTFTSLVVADGALYAVGTGLAGAVVFTVDDTAVRWLGVAPVDPQVAAADGQTLLIGGPPRAGGPTALYRYQATRPSDAAWEALAAPPDPFLTALWRTPEALFAATEDTAGVDRIAMRTHDGSPWQPLWQADGDVAITALWGADACTMFAVGHEGLILRR